MQKSHYLYFLFLIGCSTDNQCPQNINILPMYGNIKKCNAQLKIDQDFLNECDSMFSSRKKASVHHVDLGWGYFYRNQFDNAIKRFNQAWLLDSTNADVYWGFGNIMGMKGDYNGSLPFFEKSIKLNPKNEKVYISLATSYGNLFYETKDTAFLNMGINYLHKSMEVNPNNPEAYAKLTSCYSYYMQTDSVKKYLKLTDSLYPEAITPNIKSIIKSGIHYADSVFLQNNKSITQ